MKVPLAKILRPKSLDEIIGQRHLLDKDKAFRKLIESDKLRSFILYGPAGTGKTTIAEVIALQTKIKFFKVNATSATVKDIRAHVDFAIKNDTSIVIFVDEIHRFSKTQQDVLLPSVESGHVIFIGATTENPFHSVNNPLISRSQVFKLEALKPSELGTIFLKGVEYLRKVTGKRLKIDPEALKWCIKTSCGDGRKILGTLDMAAEICDDLIDLVSIQTVCPSKYMVYDDNQHFDLASAYQGSIQASDPDSAIYWLAKWLESGEDLKYIARRLLVSAAEDACSNPHALTAAHAAYLSACEVGRPECDILMANATIAVATSKRDKSAAMAIWAAVKDVKEGYDVAVPDALRDCHYEGAQKMGHGSYRDGKNQAAYVKAVDRKYYKPEDWL